MTAQEKEERIRRMVDTVADRSPGARMELRVGATCFVLGIGVMVLTFAGGLSLRFEAKLLVGLLCLVNLAPLVVIYALRTRRKAALMDAVMPLGQSGVRILDAAAYQELTAQFRAIEDADFRSALARVVRKIR